MPGTKVESRIDAIGDLVYFWFPSRRSPLEEGHGHRCNLAVHVCVAEIRMARQYGCTHVCSENAMARTYTLKRRAEQQAETRARIVEAAVALHGSVGPAQTTFSMVAERAGVQRHTLYAHFPDERSLLLACSGHHLRARSAARPGALGRDRRPARAAAHRRSARSTAGTSATPSSLACVLRDAEHHAVVREVSRMRYGPRLAAWDAALADAECGPAEAAMLALALSYLHLAHARARPRPRLGRRRGRHGVGRRRGGERAKRAAPLSAGSPAKAARTTPWRRRRPRGCRRGCPSRGRAARAGRRRPPRRRRGRSSGWRG